MEITVAGFDVAQLAGPIGGLIAMGYAAGSISGWTFCLRTMYKILKTQCDKDETKWKEREEQLLDRIEAQERKSEQDSKQIAILQDRLLHGMERQAAQIRDSSVHLLGRDKIGGPLE
jgi:hypothetical protein